MGKLQKFAAKLFKSQNQDSGNGLSVGLDELLNMRKYARYLKSNHTQRSYSKESGDIKSAFKGRGIEMEEIRAYQFGDDVRDIDWRVTARKDQPYTKIYQEERDHEIYVWLDLSFLMLFGSKKELKSVTAAKVAALLGWAALDNKDRFGCAIFDGQETWLFKAQRDRSHLMAILKKIAEISVRSLSQQEISIDAKLKSLRRLQLEAKNRAEVFIVSSFVGWGDNFDKELAALSQKSKLFLINIFDNLELKAPVSGQYMAAFGSQKLVFDSSEKKYRRNYVAYFENLRRQRNDFCHRFGCKLINFNAEQSFIKDLKIF